MKEVRSQWLVLGSWGSINTEDGDRYFCCTEAITGMFRDVVEGYRYRIVASDKPNSHSTGKLSFLLSPTTTISHEVIVNGKVKELYEDAVWELLRAIGELKTADIYLSLEYEKLEDGERKDQ